MPPLPKPGAVYPAMLDSLSRFTSDQMHTYAKAYAAPLLARVAELQAALHEAGDLAASSRSGPAQAESLRLIEEIAVKASEHRDGRLAALERAGKAEAENAALRAELQNIADAKPSSWDAEVRDQFMPWAQNRARAALAAHKEQP